MKNLRNIGLVAAVCVAGTSMAFDTATHAAMTAAAAGKSRIGLSPTFSAQTQSLGLRDSAFALGDKYIDIGPQLTTRLGSGFEGKIIDSVIKANRDGLITIPEPYTLTGWLMRGTIREDDNDIEVPPIYQDEPGGTFKRVYAHFHDPQNNRGLTVGTVNVGPRARDWATISGANVSGRKHWGQV